MKPFCLILEDEDFCRSLIMLLKFSPKFKNLKTSLINVHSMISKALAKSNIMMRPVLFVILQFSMVS